jgi:hypothetical protein
MLEEFEDTVASLREKNAWSVEAERREEEQPSTERFVEDAASLAIDARSEAKRRFIGRLVAKRLQIDGTDEDEAIVSDALRIVGALSEKHLLALAALTLIRNIGDPGARLPDLVAAEQWLSTRYAQPIAAILSGPGYDDETLELLGHVGAIAMLLHRSGTFLGGEHADALEQWLLTKDLTFAAESDAELGTESYRADMLSRFPIAAALRDVSRGKVFPTGDKHVAYRLDELRLTAAGQLLGMEILATLSREFSLD